MDLWTRLAAGDMPDFRDPNDGMVWVWDPGTKSYSKRPEKGIPDRSHATGGDNELFDPFVHTEYQGVPELEGHMAAQLSVGDGVFAPEGEVVCPNCREVTDLPQCPRCGKGLQPEWNKEGEGGTDPGWDATNRMPDSEFYSLPVREPKRNRQKTDDSFPSMISKTLWDHLGGPDDESSGLYPPEGWGPSGFTPKPPPRTPPPNGGWASETRPGFMLADGRFNPQWFPTLEEAKAAIQWDGSRIMEWPGKREVYRGGPERPPIDEDAAYRHLQTLSPEGWDRHYLIDSEYPHGDARWRLFERDPGITSTYHWQTLLSPEQKAEAYRRLGDQDERWRLLGGLARDRPDLLEHAFQDEKPTWNQTIRELHSRAGSGAVHQWLSDSDYKRDDWRGFDLSGMDLSGPAPPLFAHFPTTGWGELAESQGETENVGYAQHKMGMFYPGSGFRPNLEGANLSGSNLDEQDLQGESWQKSRLAGIDLSGASLRGMNLRNADLSGADLSGADLTGANVSFTLMEGANLTGARIDDADFRNAEGADLSQAIGTPVAAAEPPEMIGWHGDPDFPSLTPKGNPRKKPLVRVRKGDSVWAHERLWRVVRFEDYGDSFYLEEVDPPEGHRAEHGQLTYDQLREGMADKGWRWIRPSDKAAKTAADWGLDNFDIGRTETAKWIEDVTGQIHVDQTPGVFHEQMAQKLGLQWPLNLGALGSVYDDGTADVQKVFPGFRFDLNRTQGSLDSALGQQVRLHPPAGQSDQKGQAFEPVAVQGGIWMFPPGGQGQVTGVAWVKERANGVQYDRAMILVAEHLQPEDFHLYQAGPACIVTATGGATSHAALLARENGWTVVAGIGTDAYSKIETGNYLKVDYAGATTPPKTITVMPNPARNPAGFDAILRQRQDFEGQNPQYKPVPTLSSASLHDCPECGDPLNERDGEEFCVSCGHRQKTIDAKIGSETMRMSRTDTGEEFNGLFVTAKVGPEYVGYLVGTPYGDGFSTDYIYVAPEHRRKGIGRRMEREARNSGLVPYVTLIDQTYTPEGLAFYGALYGHVSLPRTARVTTSGPALAIPAIAEIGAGGVAAGGAAGGAGLMGGLMGGGGIGGIGAMMRGAMNPMSAGMMMGRGMGGGAPGQPGGNASAPMEQTVPGAAMQGMYSSVPDDHFLYAGTFGEEEVGSATKNDGTNSDPEAASSTGIAGETEHGDSPEQLKDVDGAGAGSRDASPYGDESAWSQDQKDAVRAFEINLPLIESFSESDESGADHPIIKAIDEMLEDAFPGYKELGDGGEEPNEGQVESLEELSGEDLDGDDEAGEDEAHQEEVLEEDRGDEDDDDDEKVAKTSLNEMGLVFDRSGQLIGQFTQYNPDGTARILTRDGYQNVDPSTVTIQKGASTDGGLWDRLAFGEIPIQPTTAPVPGQQAGIPTCPSCGQSHLPGTPCPTPNQQVQNPAAGVGMVNPAQMTQISQPGIQPKVVTHTAADSPYGQSPEQILGEVPEGTSPADQADALAGNGASIDPNPGLEYLTPDELAETVSGISQSTYGRLWNIVGQLDEQGKGAPIGGDRHDPQGEFGTPMVEDPGSQRDIIMSGTGNVTSIWDQLSPEEQTEINAAMEARDAEYEGIGHGEPEPHDMAAYGPEGTGDWPPREARVSKWADTNGDPLREGADYELRSPNYAIPDYVVIDRVGPDKVTYTITTGGMEYRDEMTSKEVRTGEYEFAPKAVEKDSREPMTAEAAFEGVHPVFDITEPEVEGRACPQCDGPLVRDGNGERCKRCFLQSDDPILGWGTENPVRPGADAIPQVTDISDNATKVSATQCPKCGGPVGDAGNCLACGRRLAAEWASPPEGHARDPGTGELYGADEAPYPQAAERIERADRQCQDCGGVMQKQGEGVWICTGCGVQDEGDRGPYQDMRPRQMTRDDVIQYQGGEGLPRGQFYPPGDPRRHQGAEAQEMLDRAAADEGEGMPKFAGDNPDSRSWLMDGGPGEGVDVDPALMAKLAGKDFSPREQREFIDEKGEARNLSKLDLEGTHYIEDIDPELALW